MGRGTTTTMQTILDAPERRIDYTVEISFPNAPVYRFATSPLTINSLVFTNDLENVGEIRQTLENPVDKVSIGLQNKDRLLGIDIAQNWQQWRHAEAVIGRLYQNKSGSLAQWVEMFRGAVQQPDASDLQVVFDVVTDTIASGNIVADRTLAVMCPFKYKDPKTCGYTGPLPTCNFLLKSAGGCDGHDNSHHFGGTEHRYQLDVSPPMPGGGDGGGIVIITCPRIDQYVLVEGSNGVKPKMVGFLTEEDKLFNPVSGGFHRIASVELVRDQPIYEVVAVNGAFSYSSPTHKILRSRRDTRGDAVANFFAGDRVLTFDNGMSNSRIAAARDTGEIADVIRIEMIDGHIYCAGDLPDKFIVSHNYKDPGDY